MNICIYIYIYIWRIKTNLAFSYYRVELKYFEAI